MEQLDSLEIDIEETPGRSDLRTCVEEYEKKIIMPKMKSYRSSRSLAAALGIDKSTLNRKIKRYGIKAEFME